jgi:putative phage-type endonuclease
MSQMEIADRVQFLGGSDCAAVLGLSRWRSPLQVWAEKTGQVKKDDGDSLPAKVGKALEDTVIALFEAKTGRKVIDREEYIAYLKKPFIACHVDGWILNEKAIFEGKTATAYKEKEWDKDEIPQEYILQCMHNLAVTGAERCYLAVLIGNHKFQVQTIERDEELIKTIIDKETEFWERFVVPKIPPTTITAHDAPVLQRLYPHETEATIQWPDEVARLVEMRNALCVDRKILEERIDLLENELKVNLKTHEAATTGKWIVSWEAQVAERLDTQRLKKEHPSLYASYLKSIENRVLRIKEMGEKNV